MRRLIPLCKCYIIGLHELASQSVCCYFKVSWKFVDHSVVIAVGNNITVTHPDKYEIVREVKGESLPKHAHAIYSNI